MYSIAQKIAGLGLRPEDAALWRQIEATATPEQLAAVEEILVEDPQNIHALTEIIRLKVRAIKNVDVALIDQIVRSEIATHP